MWIVAALAVVLFCAAGFLILNGSGTRHGDEALVKWTGNWQDWLDEIESYRRTLSVLSESKSFEYEKEEFSTRLSHGISFRFKSDSGGRLIVYLPHPSGGKAFLEKDGRKIQRVFASQRYGAGHGIEITVGSDAERRLAELVRTALQPENERELKNALEVIETRNFDWSVWQGAAAR